MLQKIEKKCNDVLDVLDIYAAPVPQFNYKGRNRIHTYFGLISTIFTFTLVMAYGSMKFTDFIMKNDPIVNTDVKHGMFRSAKKGLKLKRDKGHFKIAFAVKKHEETTFLDDEYYVEWKARIFEGNQLLKK